MTLVISRSKFLQKSRSLLYSLVLSLSPPETDDENTKATLPRCSAGFIIDVEPFSSQFNSAQHSSILCYLLYAFYLCKKLTCTNFIAQLGVKDLHSIDWSFFFLFLVWPRLTDSSHHQNFSKLWNRLKKFKGYRKKQHWLQDECSMWRTNLKIINPSPSLVLIIPEADWVA